MLLALPLRLKYVSPTVAFSCFTSMYDSAIFSELYLRLVSILSFTSAFCSSTMARMSFSTRLASILGYMSSLYVPLAVPLKFTAPEILYFFRSATRLFGIISSTLSICGMSSPTIRSVFHDESGRFSAKPDAPTNMSLLVMLNVSMSYRLKSALLIAFSSMLSGMSLKVSAESLYSESNRLSFVSRS